MIDFLGILTAMASGFAVLWVLVAAMNIMPAVLPVLFLVVALLALAGMPSWPVFALLAAAVWFFGSLAWAERARRSRGGR